MSAGTGRASERAASNAGRRRYVAVLFSDLSGSTGLTATLDADTYADILEAIRHAGAGIIAAHGGSIAQVYGDGILSLFQGAAGAKRAVEAALAMHAAVSDLAVPGVPPRSLRMHSGVHSGLVLLRPGDAVRGNLEAIGRTTSIAARLSAAARPNEVLVSVGSLGPDRAGLAVGTPRAVDIGDGTAPLAAKPVVRADNVLPDSPETGGRFAFVGRVAPLAALRAALDAVAQGDAFRILVAAPPGQGKSRLAEAFAERAQAAGVAIFRGTCSAAAAVGPLAPFRQIATAIGAGQISPTADDLVAAIAAKLDAGPLILVLDDWQWADKASAGVLLRLRALAGPLGLLLLSRIRESTALAFDGFARVDLPPLTLAETTALVANRRPAFDPLDAQHIHARAGGNPLYVEELCRLDPRQASVVQTASTAGRHNDAVAAGWLASLVGARVENLPDTAQALLETAAVIGQASPRWLLDFMVGQAKTAAALPLLIEADFVTATSTGREIEFTHGITWEIIYSLIPLATRRRLHAAVAAALAGRTHAPAVDLEESLAWHFLASDQPAQSWPHAERAGDLALRLGSLDRAQAHFRRALDIVASLPDGDPERDRALVAKFGYVCIFDADAAQFPVFSSAIARASRRGDAFAEAEAEYWLGHVSHGGGSNRAAIAHYQRALALVGDVPGSVFAVQVRAALGQAYAVATDYGRAIPLLDDAIDIKRRHRSGYKVSTSLAYTTAQRAAVHADMGDFAAAHALVRDAQALLGPDSPPVEASIMGWVSAIAAWEGDWPGLLVAATRGCDVAVRIEAVYIHAICRAFAAFARWKMGGGDAAADALAAAIDCMVDRGKYLSLSIAWGFLAEVEVARGNAPAARRAVAGAFARARSGDPMGVAWAARAWACHLAPTDPARARVYLARAWTNARQRQSRPEAARCAEVEALLDLGAAEIMPSQVERRRSAG